MLLLPLSIYRAILVWKRWLLPWAKCLWDDWCTLAWLPNTFVTGSTKLKCILRVVCMLKKFFGALFLTEALPKTEKRWVRPVVYDWSWLQNWKYSFFIKIVWEKCAWKIISKFISKVNKEKGLLWSFQIMQNICHKTLYKFAMGRKGLF